MFDTMKIAKKIREARIARNMTQMNLADAMSVSYQAVSNWERGNSMPDISKLEDLCNALGLTINQLLGMETGESAVVEKVLQKEELTVEELAEVAPILPPVQMQEQARKTTGEHKKKWNLSALTEIAPFLDEDVLEELLDEIQVDSLKDIEPLAPFLDEDLLDELVRKAPRGDVEGIVALAPFLDEDTLDWIVKQCDTAVDGKLIVELAPFLEEDTLDWLVKRCDMELNPRLIEELAPFLDEDTIDALADKQIAKGNVKSLSGLYPFMDDKTLRKLAKALMSQGDVEGMKEATMFL